MITKENIKARILSIMKGMGIEESSILKTDVIKNLGFDSLDMAELIVDIEKEFNIIISDDEAEKINNIEGAVKAVFDKVKMIKP
jgi:acyl carrier protein